MELVATIVGILSVWRVTHLLFAEDGPWGLALRLRGAAGSGFFGRLLTCFYCLSLWVALPAALLLRGAHRDSILLWLALSGGASVLERMSAPAAPFVEDPFREAPDGVLRPDQAGDVAAERSHQRDAR